LDTVVVAGEACRPEICDLHFTSLPEVNLYNEYGPTETTVWSTVYQLNPMDCGTRIPIGRPIANTKAYILDSDLQPVPPGIAGELYIGGKGVAEGYLNRPDQTILRFVSDTFQEEPGSLMYRTGDLCSFRADGVIEYHGRVDNQIKVRGYRIEPAEVQETINKFPAVRDSLVVQKPRLNNWKIQEVKDDPESLEKILSQMDPGSAEKLLRSVELLTKGDG
jgi:non-ribosomal peptide synthetase component F